MASFKDGLKNITAEEFIKKVSNGISVAKIGDIDQQKRVKGFIELNSTNYSLDELFLTNLVFEDTVRITGSKNDLFNIGSGITFQDCTFLRPLVISYCESKDINESHFAQKAGAIRIINGSYILLQISNCNFPFGAEIYGEEGNRLEIDWFESQFNHFSSAGYNFENVRFISKLVITGDRIENLGIIFRNCLSTTPIRLESVYAPNISFVGNSTKFDEDLRIWGGKLGSLIWNNGVFNNEIDICAVKIVKSLIISGSIFNNRFVFRMKDSGSQIKNFTLPEEIRVQDSKFLNGLEFHGDEFKANKLQINFSEKSSGVIDFRNTFFKEVLFKGINFNNSVFLRDCSYDKLTFSHFFNKALISLNNNNPEETNASPEQLLIENSNLGNTEFYDFDFSIYPSVRIIDSRLDSIFTYGVTWFENGQLNVEESEVSQPKILSQRREIFRQLKLAAEKQSDRITSLDFKAREVEVHAQLIQQRRNEPNTGFQNWLIRTGDLASIWLGKTNRHGQSWLLPFGLLILATIIIYPFLVISADPIISWKWDWSYEGWSLFKQKMSGHFSVFPQLFNPARRFKDLFDFGKITIPTSAHFWDGLQRIILAFFIFQIVSAFRKFVK